MTQVARGRAFKPLMGSALFMVLSACGGGGGGSSAPTPTPTPPVVVQPPANGGIPSLFEASIEENNSFENIVFTDFTVNAPSNEEPRNLALVGPDAEPFTVSFAITAPDSNGNRVVTTTLLTSRVFNFEAPADANGDNLYEFDLTGTFQGVDLASEFKVQILDVDDDAETSAFTIQGETALQTFGVPFTKIPDVSGDGNAELAVTNVTGKGNASAYIIESEFIAGATSNQSVGADTASGVRFTTANNAGDFTPNALSALAQADGSGTDVLLSADGNIYVFPIDSEAEYAALRGNIDPSSITDRIVYSITSPDGEINATLIPDVNGDDINDIAVVLLSGNDGSGEAGIIYGVDGTGTPKTIADGFDVTFNFRNEFNGFVRAETADFLPIPDVDGDGVADLILRQRNFSDNNLFFLKSAALGTASTTSVDLDALDLATQGFRLRDHEFGTVVAGQDYDGDGIQTLLFFDGVNDVFMIDGDEFAAIDPDTNTRLFGSSSATLTRQGGQGSSFGAMVEDMNGDGKQEFLGVSRFRSAVYVIDGQIIEDTLNNSGMITELPQEDEFDIDLSNFFGSDRDVTFTPAYLDGTDQFVVAWASDNNPQVETDPGRMIFFDAGVVRDAFSSGATGVTIIP